MSETVAELYNNLTLEAQKEVYDFMLFLVQKNESACEEKLKAKHKAERKAALLEFAGSMKNTFKNIDGLEYQNSLREERQFLYTFF